MERKKNIIYFIIIIAVCIILSDSVYNSVKYHEYRRLCNQYREQLIAAENTNRKLADRIGRVAEAVERIKETTDANITDARDIIESVEILRNQIQELEDCCGSFSYNDYYEYWDSYFHDEGLME